MYKVYNQMTGVLEIEHSWLAFKKKVPFFIQNQKEVKYLSSLTSRSRCSKRFDDILPLGGSAAIVLSFLKSLFECPLFVYRSDSVIPPNDLPTGIVYGTINIEPAYEINYSDGSATMEMHIKQHTMAETLVLVSHIRIYYLTKSIIQLQIHGTVSNLAVGEPVDIAKKINRLTNIERFLKENNHV